MWAGSQQNGTPVHVCSVHVQHDVRLVLLESAVHLVQQTLVAANVSSRRLQARRVDELHPDACHSTVDNLDTLGGRLKGISRGCLILIQHAVDGGALAHASHAHDHDSAGERQQLPGLGCFSAFSCADGSLKTVGAAGTAVGLGNADALC